MTVSGRLAVLSVVIAIDAVALHVLLLRVAVVRNHPEGYVVAFALATALATLAVVRGVADIVPLHGPHPGGRSPGRVAD